MKAVKKILIAFALFVLCGLQSCYNYRNVGLLQERNDLPQYEKAEYENYRIRVNDELIYRLITMDQTLADVISSGANANSTYANSYRVYSDGTIDLPFIDEIPVAGLTILEAEERVQERFREIIPDAEIKLALYNKTFTVIGDVGTGIFHIYKEKMTIFQALALSGDLYNTGDRKHVRIIRTKDEGKPEVLEFDIRSNSVIESKYYYVYPNDVIYVQRASGSFYKVSSYAAFLGLITSSLSLLITVLYYVK